MIEIVIEKVLRNIAQPNSAILGQKVSGITSNSKEVQPNFVFVAIQGINVDGNQFIKEALNKEAVCVITDSNDIEETDRIIKVENARKALTYLAANYYGNPEKHIKTIGITGTNGKTSTTLILKDILEANGKKVIQVGTLGVIPDITNLNLSLTTPDSISLFQILYHAVKEEFDYAILEVSSHALSQNRVDSIAFDAVGFTNLSLDHLDYHKSLENYFNDKINWVEKGIILPSTIVEWIALLAGLTWAMSTTIFHLAGTTKDIDKTSLTSFLIPFITHKAVPFTMSST